MVEKPLRASARSRNVDQSDRNKLKAMLVGVALIGALVLVAFLVPALTQLTANSEAVAAPEAVAAAPLPGKALDLDLARIDTAPTTPGS